MVKCKCGSRTCHQCGYRLGCRVRDRLKGTKGTWRRVAILTLTVDRKRFPGGPRSAWEHITQGGYVRRLLRLLGVPTWVWVLEFQMKTGDGWPHWHIMVDLGSAPGGRLDLPKAWAFWRDAWGLGGLDLSTRKRVLANAEHAIFYITKYLMKQPEGGYPEWVLDGHGIRFVQGCRALGPLVADAGQDDDEEPSQAEPRKYPPRRSHIDRLAECSTATKLFARSLDRHTGEVRTRYLGELPCKPDDLVLFSQRHPDLPARFSMHWDPETETAQVICDRQLSPRDVAELRDFILSATPATETREDRISYTRNMTWEQNAYRQRGGEAARSTEP